jgi:tRNA(Ile)-lysidine synthase
MPPKWAHFCLDVEKFLLAELGFSPKGQTLVLAFSGGLDSTALLLVLSALAPRLDVGFVAAHLDHGLRESSAREADLAAAFCSGLGIECLLSRQDAAAFARDSNQGLEAASRALRYRFLQEIRSARAPAILVTAHQQNDLAEDVIMRLVRGTGWPGLGGMSAWDAERSLLRPLLFTPRKTLLEFLSAMGVSFTSDPSNQDQSFRRNRIREQVLPLLIKENPAFLETAGRLWRQANLDRDYFDKLLSLPVASRDPSRVLLPESRLREAHPGLRLRLFKKALDALGPGESLTKTLFELDAAWEEKRRGAVFQFPGRKTAQITPKGILFLAG